MDNYRLNWDVIGQYRPALVDALLLSLAMAGTALAAGLALGLALAYLMRARQRVVAAAAAAFVTVTRNTPLLLLVFIVYLVLPQYGLRGLSATATFVLALTIVASGYIAENFRAAFATIPEGYRAAAKAIGLNAAQRELYVTLPIAVRYALPALTNSAVAVFKDTSLAAIIAVKELTYIAREITTNTFHVFEAWASVSLIYLAVTAAMALVARGFEARLARLS